MTLSWRDTDKRRALERTALTPSSTALPPLGCRDAGESGIALSLVRSLEDGSRPTATSEHQASWMPKPTPWNRTKSWEFWVSEGDSLTSPPDDSRLDPPG